MMPPKAVWYCVRHFSSTTTPWWVCVHCHEDNVAPAVVQRLVGHDYYAGKVCCEACMKEEDLVDVYLQRNAVVTCEVCVLDRWSVDGAS